MSITIKTCASSANVGPGFDCLGLALDIYNTFEIELAEKDELLNVDEIYDNAENLFLRAYRYGLSMIGTLDHIRVKFNCDIPVARGLGSSSSLIVGGLAAAGVLHGNIFSRNDLFRLAAKMEGHPDNAAPCVYGGFRASLTDDDNHYLTRKLDFHPDWKLTVLIPDFEVTTLEARKVMPNTYDKQIATTNSAKGILLCKALADGDLELLRKAATDQIHEPYRRSLIEEFDEIKEAYTKDTDGVLLISGSGSSCLGIAKRHLSPYGYDQIAMRKHYWRIREVSLDTKGVEIFR